MALVAIWVREVVHASGGSAILASAERDGLTVVALEHGVVRCRDCSVKVWWRRCWWRGLKVRWQGLRAVDLGVGYT
jgi:hypothetical protein